MAERGAGLGTGLGFGGCLGSQGRGGSLGSDACPLQDPSSSLSSMAKPLQSARLCTSLQGQGSHPDPGAQHPTTMPSALPAGTSSRRLPQIIYQFNNCIIKKGEARRAPNETDFIYIPPRVKMSCKIYSTCVLSKCSSAGVKGLLVTAGGRGARGEGGDGWILALPEAPVACASISLFSKRGFKNSLCINNRD